MLFFSILIVYGLYSGFNNSEIKFPTAKITKLAEESTSSVKTTITASSTIRHTTVESTTTTTSSISTTSTIQPGDPECEELGCPYGTNFVGSKNSKKYHYCSCSYAKSINPENLICFNNTEEAEEKGYAQSSCQPSTSTTTNSTSTSSSSSTSSSISTSVSTTSITSSTTTSTTTTTVLPSEHVVFSEVFYDTPGKDLDEEWIELYNPMSNSVDISGLKIEDNGGTYTIPNGTTISPGEFLIIARNETGFQNLYGFLPDLSDFNLDLANSGDYVKLKNDIEEIDMVAWEGKILGWENLKANTNKSIQRVPPIQDTDTPNDWISNAVPGPGN